MWRNPLLIAGNVASISRTITVDTLIGNLHTYLGSPSGPQSVEVIVDGVDVGDVRITTAWAAGSTFDFTCINGGRILGLGGAGGQGANRPLSAGYSSGNKGTKGGHAIDSQYDVTVDVDDGYLLGGGGGGGGGAGWYLTGTMFSLLLAGGGGGGGQGYTGGAAGPRGNNGSPAAQPGTAGTRSQEGAGGSGSLVSSIGDGGNGGKWGSAGGTGEAWRAHDPTSFVQDGIGGVGGEAGAAFFGQSGASVTFNGAKSEATLRAEGRVKGQSAAPYLTLAGSYQYFTAGTGSSTHGFTFQTDGDTLDLGVTNSLRTGRWLNGTLMAVGNDYQVRVRTTGIGAGTAGTFDTTASADNLWNTLTANRTWSFTNTTGDRGCTRLFEIRRADVPGNPDSEIIGAYWLTAVNDN